MNYTGADTVWISVEYERRARELPAGFYARGANLRICCCTTYRSMVMDACGTARAAVLPHTLRQPDPQETTRGR